MSDEITIRHDLEPGDLGRIIALHGELYDDVPGFGLKFEAYVARTFAEFILDANGDGRIWQAERDGQLIGCTAIVFRKDDIGQLRWVLLHPAARGAGLGKSLVNTALQYCRDNCCVSIVLETTDGLPESQTLYESLGFEITSEEPAELWDGTRQLIKMELRIA